MSYEMDKKIFSGNKKTSEKTTIEKLSNYLEEVSCTDEEFEKIIDAYDQITKNQSDFDDLTKFLDDSEKKSSYDYFELENFMNDLISKYEDEYEENLEDEFEEELEDEEIAEVTGRENKGIKVWFKGHSPKKIAMSFKNLFNKNKHEELEDEEIEEVSKRNKFSFKSLFGKKNKSKEDKKVKEENKSEIRFEDLNLQSKLFKYLEGTNSTWKHLANIVNKVAKISENEDQVKELDTFLNDNKDLDSAEKVVALVYKIVEILNQTQENKNLSKLNPKSETIKKFFAENNLDTNEELISLYNEIVMSDENIDKLYDFITNNEELAKDAENVIAEMNKILGKKIKNTQSSEIKLIEKHDEPKKEINNSNKVELKTKETTKKTEVKNEKEEPEAKTVEYGNVESYKNILNLIKLCVLYKSIDDIETAKALFNKDRNTFTIRQVEDVKLNLELATKNINQFLQENSNDSEFVHPFVSEQISKIEESRKTKSVGDMTLSNEIYKVLCERIKMGLRYGSSHIVNTEKEIFNNVRNYLTISQREDLKLMFEKSNKLLNQNKEKILTM